MHVVFFVSYIHVLRVSCSLSLSTAVVVRFTDTLARVTEGESEEICAVLDSGFSISESPPVTIELTPGFAMGMCTLYILLCISEYVLGALYRNEVVGRIALLGLQE